MEKTNKKVILLLLVLLLVATYMCCTVSTAFAEQVKAVDLDITSIDDDLSDIDIIKYPKNIFGRHRIISFQEYCYSDKPFSAENYGLYVYVYNPTEEEVATAQANAINIAVQYNAKGEPSRYENVLLTYLDKTDNNRFYKFKVSNSAMFLTLEKDYNSEYGFRRYDIASVQLRYAGGATVKDETVSKTYVWTGYAKGCATNSNESSLVCNERELETLTLEAKTTTYRPDGTNGKDNFTQDSLTSVYFAVPNSTIQRYGDLYKIHATWLEALTKPILVTGNKEVYNATLPYVGKSIAGTTDDIEANRLMWAFIGNCNSPAEYEICGNIAFNAIGYFEQTLDAIHYLLYAENGDADSYDVSAEKLQAYMLDYANKYGYDSLVLGKYSNRLFDEVDSEYTEVEITAEDTFSLTSELISQKFWDRLWGRNKVISSETFDGIEAIHAVVEEDFKSNYLDTCKGLYINSVDYTEFKKYYDNATSKDETVFLFRFALDDYYCVETTEWKWTEIFGDGKGKSYTWTSDTNAYFAQETVYLDFDIIDVTFKQDTELTVIPVVMSPFDIIPGLTPPVYTRGDFDWLDLLAIILGILLFGLIVYVIILCLPALKLLFAPVKAVAKSTSKAVKSKVKKAKRINKKKK